VPHLAYKQLQRLWVSAFAVTTVVYIATALGYCVAVSPRNSNFALC